MKKTASFKLHPAGMILFCAAFLLMESRIVVAAFIALALHEIGHILAMQLCRMRISTLELTPFGGMLDTGEFESHAWWKQCTAAAAGVVSNAVSAFWIVRCAPHTAFWHAIFEANLTLCLFNALPIWPLDGGRFLVGIAALAGVEQLVKKFLSWLTTAVGIGLEILGLWGVWHGTVNPSLLAMGPYLCYAARTEKVTTRIRRMGECAVPLQDGMLLPVSVWAGKVDISAEMAAAMLGGRAGNNRMNVLLRVDPVCGKIQGYQSEKEIWNEVMEQIDGR